MPPAALSTSGAKASAYTPRAPQNRITIAAAAPPQSASVCGRYGTESGSCACAGATELAVATSATATIHCLTPSVCHRDDNQDHEQDDDDRGRRNDDRGAAGEVLVDGARLGRGLAQLVTLQR